MATSPRTRKRSRSRRAAGFARTLRNFVLFLIVTLALSTGAALALLYWEISGSLPPIDKLAEYRPPVATQVLADDGTVVAEFYFEKRYLVPLDEIPLVVRDAFLAAEDDGFYHHGGIDLLSIGRAFINNMIAGGKVQGGSTITQQVVKSLLLTPEKSYERKVKEVLLATRLERQLTKDQILSLYLNHIYLGSGAYGVAAAAQVYFGKSVQDLDLAEAALLAGLPQAPSRYSPFNHWPLAKARQRYVLDRMADVHFITRLDAAAAMREPLALASHKGSYKIAPYYVEYVRRLLEERYGETAVYALGLRVHTALDLPMQAAAEAALRHGLRKLTVQGHFLQDARMHLEPAAAQAFLHDQQRAMKGQPLERDRVYEALVTHGAAGGRTTARVEIGRFKGELEQPAGSAAPLCRAGDVVRVRLGDTGSGNHAYRFVRDEDPPMQGAFIALDPRNGTVKALVGGYDFKTSQFNRAVQGARQPGSAFKPLIYAAALDRHFTPATVIDDSPVSFRFGNQVWAPHNYEDRFYGPTTLREALTYSRNVVTVKLASRLGIKYIIRYVRGLGLRSPLQRNLSLALGSCDVTLLDLASTYAVFANQGERVEPRFITKITDGTGHLVDDNPPQERRVMSPETAYMITSMMESVIDHGTGWRAKALGRPAAGKTGTTNDMNDAWFIGYTPQLLAGVWVGFDETRTLGKGETGGHVAAPIWERFMAQALHGQPTLHFQIPPGIRFVPIDPHTGQRVLPGSRGSLLECFRHGTEPRAVAAQAVDAAPHPQAALVHHID